jgi:hypothetical protein
MAEPICCGDDCDEGKCNDGLWPDATHIALAKGEGCAAASSEHLGGLLCCYGADDIPTPGPGYTVSRTDEPPPPAEDPAIPAE